MGMGPDVESSYLIEPVGGHLKDPNSPILTPPSSPDHPACGAALPLLTLFCLPPTWYVCPGRFWPVGGVREGRRKVDWVGGRGGEGQAMDRLSWEGGWGWSPALRLDPNLCARLASPPIPV